MSISMALMGAPSLGDLESSYVTTAAPVCDSHVVSAFPHLDLDRWRY
jgi:hypothetical protein